MVRPFVFRKYLDFGAYESMRRLHAQLRKEVERREMHDNIKLGPGGIREIEFITQVFQLIRGGRDVDLCIRPTLSVLQRLQKKHQLPEQAATELTDAYHFLRKLEHRLQYLDDQQIQTLPLNPVDQNLIATVMGFPDYASFMQQLDTHRKNVTRLFELIFVCGLTCGRLTPKIFPKPKRPRHNSAPWDFPSRQKSLNGCDCSTKILSIINSQKPVNNTSIRSCP